MRFTGATRYLNEESFGAALLAALLLFIVYHSTLNPLYDAQRKRDLHTLQGALEAYAKANGGSYQVPAGYNGSGQGWVNRTYGAFPSIVSVLHAKGLLKVDSLDDPLVQPGYLLFLCGGDKYSLSAELDWPSPEDSEQASNLCNALGKNGFIEAYKKNYALGKRP